MLSDCSSCKFFNPELCAVNPVYRERADRWRGRLSEQNLADLGWLGAELQPCADWERSPELEPVALELTLSRRQWLEVSRVLARTGLLSAIAPQLQGVVPQAQEIQMVAVDSSNVRAIDYDSVIQVLMVDFINGSRYRYRGVPITVFEDFLNADSKGRFLNYLVKGRYEHERVDGAGPGGWSGAA